MTLNYDGRQRGREVVLLDEVTVAAAAVHKWIGFRPAWSKNPRFQLLVADGVFGAAPQMVIDIEHYLISSDTPSKLGTFSISADGIYELYTEALETRFPYPMVRARIVSLADMTSAKLTLVGIGDRE